MSKHHTFSPDAGEISTISTFAISGKNQKGVGIVFYKLEGGIKAEIALDLNSARSLIESIQTAIRGHTHD